MLETQEIKNLYNEYATHNIGMTKEYYKINHTISLCREEIFEKIQHNEELQKLIDNLCQLYKDAGSIDCEQCFIYGYGLGTRLTAESFILKTDNTEE